MSVVSMEVLRSTSHLHRYQQMTYQEKRECKAVFCEVVLANISMVRSKQFHEISKDLAEDYGDFCERRLYRAIRELVKQKKIVVVGRTIAERAYIKVYECLDVEKDAYAKKWEEIYGEE